MCSYSASDFPLMTAAEMGAVMGTFVDSRVNFVTGSAMMEQNRAELYVDDQVREFVEFVVVVAVVVFSGGGLGGKVSL